jgi:RND family efflux transporter MFP subunit
MKRMEDNGMIKKAIKLGGVFLILVLVIMFWSANRAETGPAQGEEVKTGQDAAADSAGEQAQSKEKKIKYWVAPMDPNYIRNEPGKSPMGMDLVPVYEEEGEKSSEGVISIDPVTVQNIGVRTAVVKKGQLSKSIRAAGRITYDEKLVEHIHTKVSGWVEELYVDTSGQEVSAGQALMSFYSPELVATQEEYLQALRYREKTSESEFPEIKQSAESLAEAARKRLLYMDLSHEQIDELEKTGQVKKDMELYTSRSGVVIDKTVLKGMKISPMKELYKIADLSKVWVIASVYEYELPFIKTGQEAEMTLSYDPGTVYNGKVTFVYPYLSEKTRTVDVRMEFENPGYKLKPDMYSDVVIKSSIGGPELLVPSEAVLRTGSRNVVITSLGKGKFLPKEVSVGAEGKSFVQILAGLEEGESIVTSGQFLIDSESNLREAVNKMLEASKPTADAGESAGDNGQQIQKADVLLLSDEQRGMMSELIGHYLQVHEALVSESGSEAAAKSHPIHELLDRLRESDSNGDLKEVIESIDASLEGLHSGDLQIARTSFKTLSRTMTGLIKGAAREEAMAAGLKAYLCPMENEFWLQHEGDLKNPYLGEDMWICGIEEKY